MMSYWSNFAYAGQPGKGRQSDLAEWQPWTNGAGNPKMIVLDSERDGGIRMSTAEVTLDSIKAEFMREKFSNKDDRCVTYRDTFVGTKAFDRSQYIGFGCDPKTLRATASPE
jgi:para-nitrobenzyl esterase